MNDEQAKYAYEKIGEYREEAKKADRKAFWQLLVAEASVVLIAADAVATKVFNAIPRDIAIGAGVNSYFKIIDVRSKRYNCIR